MKKRSGLRVVVLLRVEDVEARLRQGAATAATMPGRFAQASVRTKRCAGEP